MKTGLLSGKKAQMTMMIITGLLILIAVVLFVAMRTPFGSEFLGPPSEVKEIVQYTETCIDEVADEGIFMMSMQGGWIELPEELADDPKAHIEHGFDVAMWHHDNSDTRPSIEQMENELENYIDYRLMQCLNFYMPFQNRYDVTSEELPKTEVDIELEKVSIKTRYPLLIKKRGADEYSSWDTFTLDIDSDIGKRYALADDLMDYENSEAFLEDYTDEMIACSDYLPYEGMEITCSPRIWFVDDLKEYTQTLVMHNLHFLQFENTDYDETGMPYYDKQYKVDFTNNDYRDYKVEVIYDPQWGMDFDAHPSDNGMVEPYEFEITEYVRSCVKVFHERYSTEYPVLFRIYEKDDPENAFYFATPVLMRYNQPNRYNEIKPAEVSPDEEASEKYCQQTEEITQYSLDAQGHMVAEKKTRNKQENELRVYAIDALHGYPDGVLQGVNISYQCVRFKCDMGQTGYDEEYDGLLMVDSAPMLATGFPECTNGIIIAEKPGYQRAVKHQTVSEETDGEQVTIEMHKLKEFDFGIRVVQDHNGVITDRQPEDRENVLITLKNEEQDFEEKLLYPSDIAHFNNLTLMLGDFTYELEIMLTKDGQLLGGAELNWTPQLDDLFYKNYVEFYVFKKDPLVATSTPKEAYQLYEASLEKSVAYPPRMR